MLNISLKQYLSKIAISRLLKYLQKDPKKNLPKIVNLLEKVLNQDRFKGAADQLRIMINNKSEPWTKLIYRFFDDISPKCQEMFIKNFIINSSIHRQQQEKEISKIKDINVPWAILLDPTSKCNLSCTGCWAGEYNKEDELDFDTIDRIITEGKELGIYMYIYSGGEPTVRKNDLIKLAEKHNNAYFLAFTNGTLVDEKFAKELGRVGNFVLAFSIEGDEEETDFRRGRGTYNKVLKGMENCKEEGVLFGISTCYHHKNYKNIGSEKFTEDMISKGAFFEWMFTYIPIGKEAVVDLCCRPEEREHMYYRVREMRKTKDLFFMDFWNDAEYVGGCIAGGRTYFHINANGDVEPCAFVHYSDTNIKDVSLLEALNSKLFKQYRKNWPFNKNPLRPCPIFDNPKKIVSMVNESGAKSTQILDNELVEQLCDKCLPISEQWSTTADELWEKSLKK